MATAAPEEEVVAEEPKKKKPIVLIIGGVVGLIVLIVGIVLGTLFFTGYFNPKPPVDPEAAAEAADAHGGGHGDKKGDAKPGKKTKDSPELTRFEYTYMQIEREFLVNVSGSKKVMSVQIAVMTHYDDRVFENVKKHDFAIRSAVMDVMRLTTDADLVKPDFRKELAAKIRDAINTLLEKYEDFGGIEEIHFTNFIVQ
ncbi:flagellar basal body-associated FliL family protein [Limnohabitans sp. 103DPR2]|jgi:flagellar FliL protein|uniref:flagellar basal body-associated FliL family protein n=1 Tax=Limnohabitans sp. 103DPR2 TaxID=1678129 RepID=UPI0006DCAD11|nr:flagellar basal body-associated FliL family protein [Limnohabitans sp. 103DPR2]ALK90971.1 flagellar basal body-associated protein FliL [Limnohabitans sp. 103DPR2]